MKRLLVGVLVAAAMLLPGVALAGTTGTVAGVVTDNGGKPISGVRVTANAPSQTQATTTDASGFYSLQALTPDTYSISFEKPGFQSSSIAGIAVFQDQTAKLNAQLQPSLKVIANLTSKAPNNLVKPFTTTDVYNVSGAQLNAATGGDNLHRTIYEYLDTVPGVTPIGGAYPGEPSIHGGYDVDNGYELDGIPITERMTGYFTTNLTDLGIGNVEVYTAGLTANNAGNGLGVINSVIKTGTYPGFANFSAGVAGPDFTHFLRTEIGNATPNHKFSYYIGFDAADNQNQFNNGNVSFPIYTIGISSGSPGYIQTRDLIGNFHYRPSTKDDIQVFYQNSLFDDKVTYNLFSGTASAPLLKLLPCPGAGPDVNTVSGASGGTAPNGQTCPDGLYFGALPNGAGNYLGHYSAIGKIQWNRVLSDRSSLALRLAENFNQYIFNQPLSDPNLAVNNAVKPDSGCPDYPYAAGTPLIESNGTQCTFDFGDYYQNRYGNDYYLQMEYRNTPSERSEIDFGIGQEYDNQKRDVRYLNLFNSPTNTTYAGYVCGGQTFSYSCLNSYTDIPTHVPYVYAQGTVTTGKFTLSPGLRYSRISYGVPKEFGGAVGSAFLAPNFGATYRMNGTDVLRGAYSTSAQFIGTEFVYRLGSTTYNPQKNGSNAYQPQLNHTLDLQWEHQFSSSTSLRIGPYYRVTNNYLGSFPSIIGTYANGAPKLGPSVLANGLHIRSLGAEIGLNHNDNRSSGLSYWFSTSYNNYWTQMSEYIGTFGAGGGQVAFVSTPLNPYFLQKGVYVRGYLTPLVSSTLVMDIHSNGTHILPNINYAWGNFFNTGGCLPAGTPVGLDQPLVACTSSSARKNGPPVLGKTQIAPAYWFVNLSFVRELGKHAAAGIRISNLFDIDRGATPCYAWHDSVTDAKMGLPANQSSGCIGQNGPQSNYMGPTGYIYQGVTQTPRSVEGFVNFNIGGNP